MIQKKPQTFNDGIVNIYTVDDGDAAGSGGMPKPQLTRKETLRYHQRTVGFSRAYAAMQAGQQVDAVLRCPRRKSVSAQDIAIVGDKQYLVEMVQYPEDVTPPVMDLTLRRWEQDYELADD